MEDSCAGVRDQGLCEVNPPSQNSSGLGKPEERTSEENSHGDKTPASSRGQLLNCHSTKIWKGAVKSRNIGNYQEAAAWLQSKGQMSRLFRTAGSLQASLLCYLLEEAKSDVVSKRMIYTDTKIKWQSDEKMKRKR